jgi:hypothetical protein
MRMNAMEPAGAGPARDGGPAQSHGLELLGTENAVLPTCQLRESICVGFVSLSETNRTQNGHEADPGRPGVP